LNGQRGTRSAILKKEQSNPRKIGELLGGKKIYLFDTGQKGRPFLSALERNGYKAEAFLDSAPVLIGTNCHKL
jgi:hypothetical protein